MSLSDEDRVAAKVEEVDRLIAELQERKRELLGARRLGPVPPAARAEEEPKVGAQPPQAVKARRTAGPSSALERTLDSLPWKAFKKKEGEWAFLRDREGRLIDELQSEKEFVDKARKEGQVVVGRYRYQVSEDKFLNRYFAGSQPA